MFEKTMTMRHQATINRTIALFVALAATLPAPLLAQTVVTANAAENTFVESSQPSANFNNLGGMQIGGASTNTVESLLQFNTAAIDSTLNSDYGVGNWVVTGVSLKLFSNMASAGTQPGNSDFNTIAAGGFELDWLSNNSWNPSTVTWNTLPNYLGGVGGNVQDSLGDFNYLANGTSPITWTLGLDPNMVNNIDNGTPVSIFGDPTSGSSVGYLFNTIKQNNPAVLSVTAEAVPEPGKLTLLVSGLAGLAAARRWKS